MLFKGMIEAFDDQPRTRFTLDLNDIFMFFESENKENTIILTRHEEEIEAVIKYDSFDRIFTDFYNKRGLFGSN